jgi:hypothetical protein
VFVGFQGHNTGDRWFYLRYIFWRGGLAPAYLLILGLIGSCFAARRDPRFRFLLAWFVLPIALYSLSSSRTPWYLNPFVPFAAMTAVYGTVWLGMKARRWYLRAALAVLLAVLVAPPYQRAIARNAAFVINDTKRIELDRIVSDLRYEPIDFFVVGNALSGRSNPVNGRFNLEGIYREMLRPNLVSLKTPEGLPTAGEFVVFVKSKELHLLPPGGVTIFTLKPSPWRDELVSVVRFKLLP